MNASPSNRAREVFLERVVPQLSHNSNALRRMLLKGSFKVPGGVMYSVDHARFDEFFTALSCGLIYKSQKAPLPSDYRIGHIYHRLVSDADAERQAFEAGIDLLYDEKPLEFMAFGNPETRNERIYTVEIHGLPGFQGSITIVHRFFGAFKVTSMSAVTALRSMRAACRTGAVLLRHQLSRRREGQVRKATRYEKRAADYLTMVTIASIFIWLRFAEAP